MKLTLQNIGIVHSAELTLNGLTVITGYNGIGKSIVGKALYCALSARYEGRYKPDEQIQKQAEQIEEYIELINPNTPFTEKESINNQLLTLIDSGVHLLTFYINKEYTFGDKKMDERTMSMLTLLASIIKDQFNNNRLATILEKRNIEVIKEEVDLYTLEHNELIQSTFKNSYNNKFLAKEKSLLEFSQAQESIVKVEVINNKTTTIDFTQDVFSDVLLIETPTILSLFRYIKENLAFNNNQNKLLPDYIKDFIQKLSESSYTPNYDKPLCQRIQQLIKGRIIIENEQLFYEDDKKERHAIINVATGIKSLGMLQLLIAGDAIPPGSLLVVDEPEVHLHPAWQLEYARVIVELVKEGVEVIVNSHSSYFIEALDVYTQNEQIADKLNVYLGEMTEKGSVFNDVTEDLEPVYKAFAAPMVELMVERSRGKKKTKEEVSK